ncbi:MAG: ABC transporter permease [Alteromonadaceae bacterium]|nr:ABC transporter permease [Alteromonadaceae bacterium]
MIQLKALITKEFKEAFRDKRALMVAMMMAVLAPVMIFVGSKTMIKELVETPPVYAKFAGAEYAPKLMKQLKAANILSFADVPADEKILWDERNIEITIPDTFAQNMLDGEMIDIILRTDYSDKAINAPIRRIKDEIRNYARAIGYKRLLVRGVDIRLLRPVNLIEQNTALPSSNAVFISMMLGLYLLMAAFMSGLPVAIDSSAGERERNVLEMLLCQPVSTLKIVLAKLLCASSVAFLAVVLTLVLTSFSVGFVDLTKIGATFSLDAFTVVVLILLMLPICFFASALQLFFSFQAKSFKEAQSTVTMIIMLPAMIPMALMFMDDKPKWLDWLPVSGQSLLMEDLFKGIPINWAAFGTTSLVTIAMTVVLVVILATRLKSEKVVLALS